MMEGLINSCSNMAVSSAAAEAFSCQWGRIANLVSEQIESDPRIPSLIEDSSYQLLRDSHNNWAGFMKFVLRLNSCEILARTVTWEYRTLHARGVSFDYFPIEFAAWKSALQQHLEASFAAEISAVYDWLIEHHETVVQLSEAGEGLEVPMQRELTVGQGAFLTLLLNGNSRGALKLVLETVHDVAGLKRFYLDLVYPVLHRIGLLWERNEISVAEEHLATAIVGRIMAALYLRFAQPEAMHGKTAVVAAGPNELHEVGARVVADFLELVGWDVRYLGGNLSAQVILSTLKQLKPVVLFLSVTSVFHLEAARLLIREIKSGAETQEVRVMLGGFAFNCLPRLWHDFQADGYQGDAESAASAANAWWEQIAR
jgi:MerR family transcriptional regulator, light-induced transcriptional regulator